MIIRKIFSWISSLSEAILQKLSSTKPKYLSAFLVGFLVLILAGCSTTRRVTEVVESTNTDTLYLNRIQYDSIFIDHFHMVDRGKDTIMIQDAKVEYRYRLLKDTTYIHQIDSIPVIKEVEVIKEVARPINLFDRICRYSFFLLFGFLLFELFKLIKRFKLL